MPQLMAESESPVGFTGLSRNYQTILMVHKIYAQIARERKTHQDPYIQMYTLKYTHTYVYSGITGQ